MTPSQRKEGCTRKPFLALATLTASWGCLQLTQAKTNHLSCARASLFAPEGLPLYCIRNTSHGMALYLWLTHRAWHLPP